MVSTANHLPSNAVNESTQLTAGPQRPTVVDTTARQVTFSLCLSLCVCVSLFHVQNQLHVLVVITCCGVKK